MPPEFSFEVLIPHIYKHRHIYPLNPKWTLTVALELVLSESSSPQRLCGFCSFGELVFEVHGRL